MAVGVAEHEPDAEGVVLVVSVVLYDCGRVALLVRVCERVLDTVGERLCRAMAALVIVAALTESTCQREQTWYL